MKRQKHKKDYQPRKPIHAWQGWCHPSSKTRRSIMKTMDEIHDGSVYKKIGSWFEWN